MNRSVTLNGRRPWPDRPTSSAIRRPVMVGRPERVSSAPGRRAALAVIVTAVGLAGSACSTSAGSGRPAGRSDPGPNATVVRVVDGDTILAEIGGSRERVRLIGVDTPETVKPNAPVDCFGKEASNRTKQLLPEGTPVRLVLDAEERDRYGRCSPTCTGPRTASS